MSKPPPNVPAVDDPCRLRGRKEAVGILRKLDPERLWSWVDWVPGVTAPKICHLFELEVRF